VVLAHVASAAGPTSPEVRAAKMKARKVVMPTYQQIQLIEVAAPDKAPAKPAKPRRVLVWGHTWTHQPNPYAEKALEILARKTGAFEALISDDARLLLGDRLPQFDALVMNNIHEREPFLPDDFAQRTQEQKTAARKFDETVKQSILDYVRSGKGIVGIHAATAALQNWPEYGKMIGGYYGGHIHQEVVIKPEDPKHPVNACFGGKSFTIRPCLLYNAGPRCGDLLESGLSKAPARGRTVCYRRSGRRDSPDHRQAIRSLHSKDMPRPAC